MGAEAETHGGRIDMRHLSYDYKNQVTQVMPAREIAFRRAEMVWTVHEKPEGADYEALWRGAQHFAPREATRDVPRLTWFRMLSAPKAEEYASMSWKSHGRDKDRLAFLHDVLEVLDPYLASYFGSEYLPLFMRSYQNAPGDELPYSAKWHCDSGPRKHLKALIYLNGSVDHGGNTQFLDYDTTLRFDEAGYLFGPLDQRQEDLSAIAKVNGIPYNPIEHRMHAGWGILFEPSCIMHKAIWPTVGVRKMVQICFLPSRLHWEKACKLMSLPRRLNTWSVFDESVWGGTNASDERIA
jgi:hypothetical protein